MAHGGKKKLPILRITFQELQERQKLLNTAKDEADRPPIVKMEESSLKKPDGDALEDVSHSGGLLYIMPTTSLQSNKNGKKDSDRARERSHGANYSLYDYSEDSRKSRCHDVKGASNLSYKNPNPSSTPLLGQQKVRSASQQYRKSDSQKEAMRHEGSHQRALSEGRPLRRKGREEEESIENKLVSEWKHYSKKTLSKWSGDITKLDPVLETW